MPVCVRNEEMRFSESSFCPLFHFAGIAVVLVHSSLFLQFPQAPCTPVASFILASRLSLALETIQRDIHLFSSPPDASEFIFIISLVFPFSLSCNVKEA